MKVVRWLTEHFWQLASWAFLVAAVLNFGNDKGFVAALLSLGALAVHEILTALRPKPVGVTEQEFVVIPASSRN